MKFYPTMRPQLKRFAHAMGFKRRRPPKPRVIPADFDEQTTRILNAVADYTMTSPERVQALVNAVRYTVANGIKGDFVECGVWRGGSSMAVALMLKELGDECRHLYLYDTFEGMSAPSREDVAFNGDMAHRRFVERRRSDDSSDWCRCTIDEVQQNLAGTGYPVQNIHLIKGKVEDTLPDRMPAGPVSILRLDTDWYESTCHEMLHLYPRLVRNGVLIIDDYGHWDGARKAVDEYIAEHKLSLLLCRIDYTARIAVKQ